MPEQGMRYVRAAIGIDTVIVNGEVAYTHANGYTGSTSGAIATQPVR